MALTQIPAQAGVPAQSFQTELGGVLFGIRLIWNSRAELWFMDLEDAQGNDLVNGIALVADSPVTLPFETLPGMPRGRVWVIDESGAQRNPDLDTLGQGVNLHFETPS